MSLEKGRYIIRQTSKGFEVRDTVRLGQHGQPRLVCRVKELSLATKRQKYLEAKHEKSSEEMAGTS